MFLVFSASAACCSRSDSLRSNIPNEKPKQDDVNITNVMKQTIDDYIRKTREWNQADYQIRFVKSDGDIEIFSIVHNDDLVDSRKRGGGKSFELHVNKASMLAIKEYAYQ